MNINQALQFDEVTVGGKTYIVPAPVADEIEKVLGLAVRDNEVKPIIDVVRKHLSNPSIDRLENICGCGLYCGDRPYKQLVDEKLEEWRDQLKAAFDD